MKTFREFLTEGYRNFIGNNDRDFKVKYMNDVWDILQKSYAPIGGIKGSGFNSPEDMLNIPFWKVITVGGKVVGVIMYKDKEGRKSVAVGTDGSEHAKNLLINTLKQEVFRSYGEKSKGSLGLFMKIIPFDILKNFLIPVEEVKKILHEAEIIPYSEVSEKDLPIDAKHTLEKYPQLKDFSYFREISGHLTFKVMVGTPHKKIVDTR